MSQLARELDRQLVWLEKIAKDLAQAVGDLVLTGNSLMKGTEWWDEAQADAIRMALNDHADECGRYITTAHAEVLEFHRQLSGGGS